MTSKRGRLKKRLMRVPHLPRRVGAPFLQSQRLVLKPHDFSGASQLDWAFITGDRGVGDPLHWPVRKWRAAQRHLKQRIRHDHLYYQDDFMALAVWCYGNLIAEVSLHLRDVETRRVEIGWLVGSPYQRHGIAREAAGVVIEWATNVLGSKQIDARIDPENGSSVALAERLGFEYDVYSNRWIYEEHDA